MFNCTFAGSLLRPQTHSLLSQVWRLFLPMLLYSVIGSFTGIADMYLASSLGARAQAAVGFGDQVIFLVVVIGTGLCTASSSFVSRATGGGDPVEAARWARETQTLAIIIGAVSTVIGIISARPILECLQCAPEMIDWAAPYVQICSLANAPFVLFLSQAAILRAIGKAADATYIALVTTTVTICASFALFHTFDAPFGHSLASLAFAWIAGAFAGMGLGGFYLKKNLPQLGGENTFCRQSMLRLKRLAETALPAVAGELAFVIANIARYALISSLPDSITAQAAWTIRLKLEETIAILPLMALSCAVAVVAGQCQGAGRGREIGQLSNQVALISSLAMLFIGIGIAIFAEQICMVFTLDATTLNAAKILISPAPVVLPCCAVWLIYNGAMDGAGLTRLSGSINMADALMGRLLLSFLCLTYGLEGFARASTAASVITAVLSCMTFRHVFHLRSGTFSNCSIGSK